MEFKSTDSVEKLEEVSKEALEQIEAKKYDISLKQNGIKELTYIGIAFYGKQLEYLLNINNVHWQNMIYEIL